MNDRNAIVEELTGLLEKLALQTERILSAGRPSALDIDLARDHLRRLYESFDALEGSDQVKATPEPEQIVQEIPEPQPEAPVAVKEIEQEIPEPQPEAPVAVEIIEQETPEPEPQEVSRPEPEPLPPPPPPPTPVAQEYSSKGDSLFDKFVAEIDDKSVGAKLKRSKISDLRKSIGINEKFIFSKELFGGNINVYEEAIHKLNDASGITEAFALLDTYYHERKWDEESDALRLFIEFIQRRHV